MKYLTRFLARAVEFGILIVVVVLVILIFQQMGKQAAPSSCPVPLQLRTFDSPLLPVGSPTPWPPGFTPPPPRKATPITFRISRTVDMRPDLPADEKGEVVICKPGGVYVKILTPPTVRLDELPMDRVDVVVAIYSPRATMGQRPPKPTVGPFTSPLKP
jgi:hypothetical protein